MRTNVPESVKVAVEKIAGALCLVDVLLCQLEVLLILGVLLVRKLVLEYLLAYQLEVSKVLGDLLAHRLVCEHLLTC